MTLGEFIEANNRLESYYEKEYTTEQRQIMYEELKNLSVERYKKVIAQCIRTCKFMPKIADIVKANMEIVENRNIEETRNRFECDKCNGTGYVAFTKIIQDGNKVIPYVYSARCVCENANYVNVKVPNFKELGVEVSNRINQVRNTIRDIDEIRRVLLKKV